MERVRQTRQWVGMALLTMLWSDIAFSAKSDWTLLHFSDKLYTPTLHLEGTYGTDNNSHMVGDLLYPVYQRNDRMGFVDIRGMLRKSPVKEFNLGGGYRWLSEDNTQFYGAYGFYDRKMSQSSLWYDQLTLGGEFRVSNFRVGGNVYIPLGTTTRTVSSIKTLGENAAVPFKDNLFKIGIVDEDHTEYALTGIDLEVGYDIPQVKGLTAYLGGYHFSHNKIKDVSGPRLSVAYDVLALLDKKPSWLNTVSLTAMVQHDDVRGTLWFAGVGVSIPLGNSIQKKASRWHKAMTSMIRRDVDVVVASTVSGSRTLLQESGEDVIGAWVNSEAELKSATAPGTSVDVIAINGEISIAGNPYVDSSTDAAIVLQPNQILVGDDLVIAGYSVPLSEDPTDTTTGDMQAKLILTGANTGHLLRVTQNNKIQDMAFEVPVVTSTLGQQAVAITNTKGHIAATQTVNPAVEGDEVAGTVGTPETGDAIRYNDEGSHFTGFGDLHISRSTFTGGGGVYLNTDSGVSKVIIEDSDFTTNNPYTGASLLNDDGAPFRFSVMAPITVVDQTAGQTGISEVQIHRNTLSATSDRVGDIKTWFESAGVDDDRGLQGGHLAGISLSHLSAASVIGDNTFTGVSTSGRAMRTYGIYIDGDSHGHITRNLLQGIKATGEKGDAAGIRVGTLHGSIANNQLMKDTILGAAVFAKGYAYGIHAMEGVAETGVIRMNDVMRVQADAYSASGVQVGHWYYKVNGSEAVDEEGAFEVDGDDNDVLDDDGNRIPIPNGYYDNLVFVIKGNMNGAITENSFAGVKSTKGVAYGVYVGKDLAGEIVGNAFNQSLDANGNPTGVAIEGASGFTTGIEIYNNVGYVSYSDTGSLEGIEKGGKINSNSFVGIESTGRSAYGVRVEAIFMGEIENNVFKAPEDGVAIKGAYARGLHIQGYSSSPTVANAIGGKLNNNVFEGIWATDGQAAGMRLFSHFSGEMLGNAFNAVTITVDGKEEMWAIKSSCSRSNCRSYGVYLSYDVTEDGKINNNSFAGIEATNSYAFGVYVRKNLAGEIVGNAFNQGLNADGDPTGVAISGGTQAYGVYVYFDVEVSGKINENSFAGIDATVGNACGVYVRENLAGEIVGNAFNHGFDTEGNPKGLAISGDKEAYGVYVSYDLSSTVSSTGKINNNSFAGIDATASTAYGVRVRGTLAGEIVGNAFNQGLTADGDPTGVAISGGNKAHGVYVYLDVKENGKINNNSFAGIKVDADNGKAYGIYIDEDLGGEILGNSFNQALDASSAVISAAIQADSAYGIYVNGNPNWDSFGMGQVNDTATPTAKIRSNSFAGIKASYLDSDDANQAGDTAIGIYLRALKGGINARAITANTFDDITGATAYGLQIKNSTIGGVNNPAAYAITNNHFSVTGTAQAGIKAVGYGAGAKAALEASNTFAGSITDPNGDGNLADKQKCNNLTGTDMH